MARVSLPAAVGLAGLVALGPSLDLLQLDEEGARARGLRVEAAKVATVGLASLVLQASAPFTVLLGAALLRERLSRLQICGIVIAVLGMCVIGWHRAHTAALLPVVLTLLGALSWAFGNLCNRKANPPNPLLVWL